LVASKLRCLFLYLFRHLFPELLCVVHLPGRMSNGCLEGHKLRFLRRKSGTPERLQVCA
jgi:hypothetical protein